MENEINNVMKFKKTAHQLGDLIPTQIDDKGNVAVSGRELHDVLQIKTPYKRWIDRQINDYDFTENVDFTVMDKNVQDETAFGGVRKMSEHILTLDTAKEISMVQRTPIGKKIRQYLIAVEKAWNDPVAIMQRADQMLIERDGIIESNKKYIDELKHKNMLMSGDRNIVEKLIKDNGDVNEDNFDAAELNFWISSHGGKLDNMKLFKYLHEEGYIEERKYHGRPYSIPTEKGKETGWFWVRVMDPKQNKISPKLVFTMKGALAIYNKYNKESTQTKKVVENDLNWILEMLDETLADDRAKEQAKEQEEIRKRGLKYRHRNHEPIPHTIGTDI
jgi:Phage anti-repressor protein